MFQSIITKKVFQFSELNEEAKEVAKRWYLNDEFRCQELTSIIQEDVSHIFPNSELKVQW